MRIRRYFALFYLVPDGNTYGKVLCNQTTGNVQHVDALTQRIKALHVLL